MLRKLIGLIGTAIVLVSLSSSSVAQAPPVAPGQDASLEEAKRHFMQGVALFNDGNFSAALAEFESAYRAHPSPGVLKNIGLSQKALFRYTDAIATLEKYLAEAPKLTPEQKNEATQMISEMRALLAEVTLDVSPDGANILIDGRTVAAAPLKAPMGIAAGNHVIEVTMDGYKPARKEVIVTAGAPMKLTFKLEIIPKTGKVRIHTTQNNTSIMVDGKPVGSAPIDLELSTGGHQLEISANGYLTHRSELVVAGGQSRELSIKLDRPAKKKVYEKWYFWTPLLAIVVGAAVATPLVIIDQQQNSTLSGTLTPGSGKVTQ